MDKIGVGGCGYLTPWCGRRKECKKGISDGHWGSDWRTPGYMVREEAKRDKLRTRVKRRAWRYKEQLRRGGGNEIARECLAEVGEGEGKMSRWKREKKKGREGRQEQEEAEGYEDIEKVDRKPQERDRKYRIRKSEYKRWYREVITEEVPMYLKKDWNEERCRTIARFRLRNEMGKEDIGKRRREGGVRGGVGNRGNISWTGVWMGE